MVLEIQEEFKWLKKKLHAKNKPQQPLPLFAVCV